MPRTDLRIPGESAVVTASGSGIGRTIATELASAGVDVALNDVDGAALDRAVESLSDAPGDAIGVEADVSDPAAAEELIEAAVDAFGGLDILVNNVGVAGPTGPCEELTNEAFMETLSVNLGGQFNATRAAIPHLIDDGDTDGGDDSADSSGDSDDGPAGRIVNVASMSGKRPLEGRTPYTTSKMGVIGFTRTLAVELADRGVTVNAVCPGSVEGDRLDRVIEAQAEAEGRAVDDVEREFRAASPMDEFVRPEDVADAVLVLCSERAERMTGQDVNVTAGITMY